MSEAPARKIMAESVYGPRPTNGRRSRSQIAGLCELMRNLLHNEHPMTCRQLFALSTRPTKKTDTRARHFECIETHLDPALLAATERIEAEERATLAQLVEFRA